MSYFERPIKFQGETPNKSSICSKCMDLSGVDICENEFGIYVCEIPNEIISISNNKSKIILSGYYDTSPFLLELATKHLVSIGGETSVELKSLDLPTTISSINEYNENYRKELKKANPVIWGLIVIFVLGLLAIIGAIFFGLFNIFA